MAESSGAAFFRNAVTNPEYKAAEASVVEWFEHVLPIAAAMDSARTSGDADNQLQLAIALMDHVEALSLDECRMMLGAAIDALVQSRHRS